MQVYCLSDLNALAPYADDWDRLTPGVPFRSWTWLATWWHHYGSDCRDTHPQQRLSVLCVFDARDRLVGIAPWYFTQSRARGWVLRPLGTGEVCSDYLSILCQPHQQHQVTHALADWMIDPRCPEREGLPQWDLLELSGIEAHDQPTACLLEHLSCHGCSVFRRPGPNCWRIDLPDTWEKYLSALSKGHRKQLRRLETRLLESGRARLHTVHRTSELSEAADILVDLHQRRRFALGQPGCFASSRFTAFHRDVMPQLLCKGQLQLHWLEIDGRPAAAEYHLAAGNTVYAYQAGIEPQLLQTEPGRVIALATIRRAIQQGYTAFDFLRGDEPYKAHFRADRRPSLVAHVVPRRPAAQWRHRLQRAGSNLRRWIKRTVDAGKSRP